MENPGGGNTGFSDKATDAGDSGSPRNIGQYPSMIVQVDDAGSARWQSWLDVTRAQFLTAPCQSPRPHVVESQGHRDAGVEAHQADDVGDTGMPERFNRAVVKPLRDPARIGKAGRHFRKPVHSMKRTLPDWLGWSQNGFICVLPIFPDSPWNPYSRPYGTA